MANLYAFKDELPKSLSPQSKLVAQALANIQPASVKAVAAEVDKIGGLTTKQPTATVVGYYVAQWKKDHIVTATAPEPVEKPAKPVKVAKVVAEKPVENTAAPAKPAKVAHGKAASAAA